MAFTYSGDPASSERDTIRFLIRDTNSSSPILNDSEIDWAYEEFSNVYLAAAWLCDLASERMVTQKRIGGLEIEYDASIWSDLKQRLEAMASGGPGAAGGLSLATKAANAADSDRKQPEFALGMHDNTQASGTGY